MKQNDEYYENKREYLEEKKSKELSNCCSAPVYEETDICSDCKEHCGKLYECELCGEYFDEENGSDNPHRCNDCYEEWGDNWPDRI